jgi:hypothetical protein
MFGIFAGVKVQSARLNCFKTENQGSVENLLNPLSVG